MNTNKDRQNQSEHTTTIVNLAVVVGLVGVDVVVDTFAIVVIVVIMRKFFATHTHTNKLCADFKPHEAAQAESADTGT